MSGKFWGFGKIDTAIGLLPVVVIAVFFVALISTTAPSTIKHTYDVLTTADGPAIVSMPQGADAIYWSTDGGLNDTPVFVQMYGDVCHYSSCPSTPLASGSGLNGSFQDLSSYGLVKGWHFLVYADAVEVVTFSGTW